MDFATSRIADGKVRFAMNKGKQVAPDILIDAIGYPTTDPNLIFNAPTCALMPFGDHKGSELPFSAALTGGDTIPGTTEKNVIINALLTIIFDPKKIW